MHDIADLESRGVPGLFVATTEFIDAAVAQAKATGVDTTSVYVEHPIQDRTDEEMVAIADQVVDELIARLTTPT